jgi:hypothetical protein
MGIESILLVLTILFLILRVITCKPNITTSDNKKLKRPVIDVRLTILYQSNQVEVIKRMLLSCI